MPKFKVCVQVFGDVEIDEPSRNDAEKAVTALLESAKIMTIEVVEFGFEGGDVTGVFDADRNELEPSPAA